MNTANLQLEGLYVAIAAVHEMLVAKGIVSRDEVTWALHKAEQIAVGDYRTEALSPTNLDSVAFAPRLLMLANSLSADGETPPFSELARMVGKTKGPHNDQS